MIVVEQVTPVSALDDRRGAYQRDTITLTWEVRRQGHGRRRSDSGVEFAISLPSGAVLKEGDCLVMDSAETVVMVREALEPVYIVQPRTSQEWAYYAYQVGNRHQSVMIGESELICPQNPAVRSLFEQLHVSYSEGMRPFNAALAVIGHSHE
jgi:urease accessory protein UreE